MTDKPTRLGRGLAALIGDMAAIEGARVTESSGGSKRLPVDFIIANRANPRRSFDPELLEELTNSIREKGVMSPLLVRPTDDPNVFELIAGERRWRAAQKAGLHDVPVIVREVDDKEALELAIIENETFLNVGSNGQTEFHHVMKKMVPDENGTSVGPLVRGETIEVSESWTFQGEYDDSTGYSNMVDHDSAHTVEEFEDLSVVAFVQDDETWEVLHSAWSGE